MFLLVVLSICGFVITFLLLGFHLAFFYMGWNPSILGNTYDLFKCLLCPIFSLISFLGSNYTYVRPSLGIVLVTDFSVLSSSGFFFLVLQFGGFYWPVLNFADPFFCYSVYCSAYWINPVFMVLEFSFIPFPFGSFLLYPYLYWYSPTDNACFPHFHYILLTYLS